MNKDRLIRPSTTASTDSPQAAGDREILHIGLTQKIQSCAGEPPAHCKVDPYGYGADNNIERGGECQMDWAQFGQIGGRPLYCLVMLISEPRTCYFKFTQTVKTDDVMALMAEGFRFFGRVPASVRTDLSPVLIKNHHGKVQYEKQFLDFADKCGFTPRLCEVGGSWQKGGIELNLKKIRKSLLSCTAIGSLNDLNEQSHIWIKELNRQVNSAES